MEVEEAGLGRGLNGIVEMGLVEERGVGDTSERKVKPVFATAEPRAVDGDSEMPVPK